MLVTANAGKNRERFWKRERDKEREAETETEREGETETETDRQRQRQRVLPHFSCPQQLQARQDKTQCFSKLERGFVLLPPQKKKKKSETTA